MYLVVHNVYGVMHLRRRHRPSLTPLSIRLLSDATTPTTTLERFLLGQPASPSRGARAGGRRTGGRLRAFRTACCGACGRASTATSSMGPWLTSSTVGPPPYPRPKARVARVARAALCEGGEGGESGGGGDGGVGGGGGGGGESSGRSSSMPKAKVGRRPAKGAAKPKAAIRVYCS